MNMPSPANKPAPEPRRSINLTGREGGLGVATGGVTYWDPRSQQASLGQPMAVSERGEDGVVRQQVMEGQGPAAQRAGDMPEMNVQETEPSVPFQSTPPPPDPELTQRLAALEAQQRELLDELRLRRQDNEDLQFQLEVFSQAARQAQLGPTVPKLPDNLDPSQTATLGDLALVVQNMMAIGPAQSIRATWDVTPSEEQAVYQRWPDAATLQEPARTNFILKAVPQLRKRASAAAAAPQPAAPPASSAPAPTPQPPRATPPTPTRPVTATVPLVESGGPSGQGLQEPQLVNQIAAAYEEYQQALNMKGNGRKRNEAMRAAADKLARLQGLSGRGDLPFVSPARLRGL